MWVAAGGAFPREGASDPSAIIGISGAVGKDPESRYSEVVRNINLRIIIFDSKLYLHQIKKKSQKTQHTLTDTHACARTAVWSNHLLVPRLRLSSSQCATCNYRLWMQRNVYPTFSVSILPFKTTPPSLKTLQSWINPHLHTSRSLVLCTSRTSDQTHAHRQTPHLKEADKRKECVLAREL